MHQPDTVRGERGPLGDAVGVSVGFVAGVGVDVAVGFASVVDVSVHVVETPSPPDEQSHGQQHYDAPDCDLCDLTDDLGQVLIQEDER